MRGNARRYRCVKPLDEFQREFALARELTTARLAGEEIRKGFILARSIDAPHHQIDVVPEVTDGPKLAVPGAPVLAAHVERAQPRIPNDVERLIGIAVQEFRAELDRNRTAIVAQREDAATNPLARF